MHPATKKYLDRYAEPEAAVIDSMELPGYDHALVIPARKERPDALRAVWQCLDARVCETSLVVLVINAARDDEKETLDLLAQLRDPRNLIATRDNLTALHAGAGRPDILLVDRCSAGRTVPGRQGVGLARKIGADIALELIVREKVASRLIYTTDADVQLPGEYFEAGRGNSGVAAILYPFGHDAGTGTKLPACLYETAMLYYVAGLKWAGSPYAFTTVGSTIAVDADHYAMVRGMPKRSAGEDFYLLNKLAKTGHIRQLADPIISIGARDSDRVPFGTGAALAKIAALDDPAQDFRFYDPRIFEQLAGWQAMLKALSPGDDPDAYLDGSPPLESWCEFSGFRSLVVERGRSPRSFTRSLHEWFDGFKTLKFVHHLRDRFFPSVPFDEIAAAGFTPPPAALPAFRDRLAADCFDGGDRGLG